MPHPNWIKVVKERTIELSRLSRVPSVSLNAPNLEVATGKPTGTLPGNIASFLSGL